MSFITTDFEAAINALSSDEIVAIPTETVYGLAANARSDSALRQVFALKQRPLNHPLILHVAENANLDTWVKNIPDYAKILMQHFWPGPLTLVFEAREGALSPLITAGQNTVAIRCPKHPLVQKLLKRLPFPLAAPSANPFGKISPTTAAHVQQSFKDCPLLILDGGRCSLGIESTIVTALDPNYYQVLRQGVIDEQMLASVLPGKQEGGYEGLAVPGRLAQHYQPNKHLYCFDYGDKKKLETFLQKEKAVYLLSFEQFDTTHYHWADNPKAVAYELYYQLRLADASNASCIITELPPPLKKWHGVRERLLKASKPL